MNGPAEQASVMAYNDYESIARQEAAFTSEGASKPGQFSIKIPYGTYYFTARAQAGSKSLFSYHGLNPINIDSNYHWIPFFVTTSSKASQQDGPPGIGGTISYKNAPLSSGSISVYSDTDFPFKGMGLLTNTINEDGSFWFDLEPGSYVLAARQRESSNMGPIQKGELFCYSSANPIEVIPGKSSLADLNCYPRDDIEKFLAPETDNPRGRRERLRRNASMEHVVIKEPGNSPANKTLAARLSGKVMDTSGAPASRVVVSAYPAEDLSLFQMYIIRFKSDFMAETDLNGDFSLNLMPGTYYLVARQKIGEAPLPGELYGIYEGSSNHSLEILSGEDKSGVNILVAPIMP